MAYRFFVVPIQDSDDGERELNGFLRSHKVLTVDRRWVEQGSSSFWTFCVDYLDSAAPAAPNGKPPGVKGKVDYKEKLTPEQFAIYAKLRDVRKDISQKEAVPVYTIFTNEQLAQMVLSRASTKAALEKIAGVGNARLEKYGDKLLAVLSGAFADEASQPSA